MRVGVRKMKKRSTLERRMLTYFGLIAAASLLITVEFVYAIDAATPTNSIATSIAQGQDQEVVHMMSGLKSLRNKALLMFVVQAAVTLIVLIMFMRRITGPLQHMVEMSGAISGGDLSRTITIRTKDEIGLLAETINGLTSNIQEIVAFGQSNDYSLRATVEKLRKDIGDKPKVEEAVDELESTLDGFKDILDSFTLFPAPLSDTKGE
jgi:methyl-accepting chemotaxis protein